MDQYKFEFLASDLLPVGTLKFRRCKIIEEFGKAPNICCY